MSRFFIERPIFAWVIAIILILVGVLSIRALPINQFPNVAPPAIALSAIYPGASAQTVQDTMVQVIEQQLNGLDGLRYITSESNSDGSMAIIVTFEQGTNPDIAQVQVQNKLQLAMPLLPQEVQQLGVRVVKYQMNFMMVVGLVSEDEQLNNHDLGNYIVSNLQDPISRIKGVGDFIVFGAQYGMRIWLDPARLYSYQLTAQDVIKAIQTQNVQVSSGQLGGLPTKAGVQLNATVIGKTRLQTAEEFNQILIKVNKDGSQVRLQDIAEVALGSENFSMSSKYNNKPASGIAIRLASAGNVLETTKLVRDTIAKLEPYFPEGVTVVYPYDTSPTVKASISSVVRTLFDAIILVFLVMYLFLQNFRATIIPTMAVPVVLLGAFGVLYACGFTINNMTMFAMVLAIGLLVDDAIVVVENVERLMEEENLSAKQATIKSMQQIQGALVGIGLVICAVFLPMAFFGGSTGVIYRQFSITIIAAMSLSVMIALIFTPSLCASLLTKKSKSQQAEKGFFGWFNRLFERTADKYQYSVASLIIHRGRSLLMYALLLGGLAVLFMRIPTSFLPDEDQGIMMVQVQLPANSTAERTENVLNQVRDYFTQHEQAAVNGVFTVNGFNVAGRGQRSGLAFIEFKPFGERKSADRSVFAVAKRASTYFSQITEAVIIPIIPPAIVELGNSLGFDFYLQDTAGLGHETLMAAQQQFLLAASKDPVLAMVRPNGLADEPQYQVIIDDEKARALQISISDINQTMSVAWGSSYVNDFIDRGRVKKVYIQGIDESRIVPEDFNKWYVRNANGEMVSFANFATGTWIYGSPKLERYNGIASVEILGQPAPGYSTGEAMQAVERIAANLPQGIGMNYSGLSYEEQSSGAQAPALYALSLLIIFLCLAALYESWSIPVSVMMVIPLGILGTVIATLLRGLSNDVFFQVGMLTVMGLASKNAILIVEFAKDLHEKEGKTIVQAAIGAARLRLRPIIMTSLAFIFGVMPMAIATGASSASQHSIGNSVVGGTLAATFLAIFFVPLFYVTIAGFFNHRLKKKDVLEMQEVTQEVIPLTELKDHR